MFWVSDSQVKVARRCESLSYIYKEVFLNYKQKLEITNIKWRIFLLEKKYILCICIFTHTHQWRNWVFILGGPKGEGPYLHLGGGGARGQHRNQGCTIKRQWGVMMWMGGMAPQAPPPIVTPLTHTQTHTHICIYVLAVFWLSRDNCNALGNMH